MIASHGPRIVPYISQPQVSEVQGWVICGRGCPVPCGMWSSVPGLDPLDANLQAPVGITKIISDIMKCPLRYDTVPGCRCPSWRSQKAKNYLSRTHSCLPDTSLSY